MKRPLKIMSKLVEPVETYNNHGNIFNVAKTKSVGQDRVSVVVLLVLYTLQGIPMGLSGSIPLILKEKGVSYESLSLFSLVSLPFSLKLLWAPLVDSCYVKSFGRRKSWLVPVQFLTALAMFWGSYYIDGWLSEKGMSVKHLTIYFVFLYFLMATQDIAVDGWALTMLSRENVGMASVCNSVGQTIGVFLANQGFIALSDANWCHRHLGMEAGSSLLTLAGFMHFWGYVFVATTLAVWVLKAEEPVDESEEPAPNFLDTCRQMGSIFRLPPIHTITGILLTCRVAFAASDAAFGFKLQEYGMPKADIATVSPLLLAVGLVLPTVLSGVVSTRPLDTLAIGIPLKIATSASLWFVLQLTRTAYANGATPGWEYFMPLVAALVVHEIAGSLVFNSFMSYFSRISDPSIGGTYMTLLNTLTNLGAKWPSTLCLWMLPKITFSSCQGLSSALASLRATCGVDGGAACTQLGGNCAVAWDGYTLMSAFCFLYGVGWLVYFRSCIKTLQNTPHADWLISANGGDSSKNSSITIVDKLQTDHKLK